MKTFTTTYTSPLGPIVIESDGQAITSLRFSSEKASTAPKEAPKETTTTIPIIAETIQWLDDYFAGKRPCNVPRLGPQGTAFQKRVWTALFTIWFGQTKTYGEIAKMVDCRSAQAVGQAVGANPIALIIPCHRVIAAHGKIGGYEYGIEIKKRLLELEQL
ncbi:MAG: methylated-DNA--[Paludibacteraceae bacterium]|nr:methylated-DNA--[protein]-cysteine S-methyltransferase [Paludibacteraceae bacterium]MBR0195729.1 methylated-DNA--[protein]-cysteine S-methyltransferase [Paludibacteraceae bacterium]